MNVDLISLEFDEIKQSLKNKFQFDPNSPFKDYDFEGSALTYLIEKLAYITFYNNYYMTTSINELYLPYAQLKKNIYALGRTLGYQPARKKAARIKVLLKINNLTDANTDYYRTNVLKIPKYKILISDDGTKFSLMENVEFIWYEGAWTRIDNGIISTNDAPMYVEAQQGEWQQLTFVPEDNIPNQTIRLDDVDIDNAVGSLVVQDAITNDMWNNFDTLDDFDMDKTQGTNNWDDFLLSLKAANMFFVNNDESGISLKFGDGVLGKIPENILNIYYFITDGIEGNGKKDFILRGDIEYYKQNGTLATYNLNEMFVLTERLEVSAGGSDVEDVESIKKFAPSFWSAQNRMVTTRDYELFLSHQQSIPLDDIKCMSGEELRPIRMGAVGICATKSIDLLDFKRSHLILTDEEQMILSNIIKSKSITSIAPIFIDPEFVSVNVNSTVYFDSRRYQPQLVDLEIENVIAKAFNDIRGFDQYFKHSNVIQALDNAPEINHNNTSFTMNFYKLVSKKDIMSDIYLNLNNPLSVGQIDKIELSKTFLKVFNRSTYYDIYNENGVPTFRDTDNQMVSELNHMNNTRTKVHKMFKYEISDIPNNDGTGTIYLNEYYAVSFVSEKYSEDQSRLRFIPTWQHTGKVKEFGKITYATGLIQLYTRNSFWMFMNDNQKNLLLGLETRREEINKTNEKLALSQNNLKIKKIMLQEKIDNLRGFWDIWRRNVLQNEVDRLQKEIERLTLDVQYYADVDDIEVEYFYVDSENSRLAYKNIEDLFLYDYYFDEISQLPIRYDDELSSFVEIDRGEVYYNVDGKSSMWINGNNHMKDTFPLQFAFQTSTNDFESVGNVIIMKGQSKIAMKAEMSV